MTTRLGELLVREKLISLQQLRQAQEEQRKGGSKLGFALAKLGFISDGEITNFLSTQYRVPAIDLTGVELDKELTKLVSKEVCERHHIIPVARNGSSVTVAMADPTNLNAIDDIKFLTGYNVEVVVAAESAITEAIAKAYTKEAETYSSMLADFSDDDIDFAVNEDDLNAHELEREAEGAPVVRLVNAILVNAIQKGASDIHIEPYEKTFRVRYRVDGVLIPEMEPPMKLKNPLVSRLKIMSSLDIAERRLPQDGRIKLKLGKNLEMDFRVSVLPCQYGEKIVLRLLDKANLQLDMTKLGFDTKPLEDFKWAIEQPWGMTLVTGPTGSGKTTTLYTMLDMLNTPEVNISTIEDPIEYQMARINQSQVKPEIGFSFANGLRTLLRQDPDIVMVGEIRDEETASLAIKASLTGHVVLSTIHTNSAAGAVPRMTDMGSEPFLIISTVKTVIGQRLVRRLSDSKEKSVMTRTEIDALGKIIDLARMLELLKKENVIGPTATWENLPIYRPVQSEEAPDGYKGRVGIHEVMTVTTTLKEMILKGASEDAIQEQAKKEGMMTMLEDGIYLAVQGETTIEEVLRVVSE